MTTASVLVPKLSVIGVETSSRDRDSDRFASLFWRTTPRGFRAAMLATSVLATVSLGWGLGCAVASAEEIVPLAQGANIRTGTIQATITVTFATAPAAGSTVSCNLTVLSNDAHLPSENAFTIVTASGSQAVCSMPVHYRWQLSSAASNMTIAYSVSGPSQSSSATFSKFPIPASGAVTAVAIAVSQ